MRILKLHCITQGAGAHGLKKVPQIRCIVNALAPQCSLLRATFNCLKLNGPQSTILCTANCMGVRRHRHHLRNPFIASYVPSSSLFYCSILRFPLFHCFNFCSHWHHSLHGNHNLTRPCASFFLQHPEIIFSGSPNGRQRDQRIAPMYRTFHCHLWCSNFSIM